MDVVYFFCVAESAVIVQRLEYEMCFELEEKVADVLFDTIRLGTTKVMI
jgi:hypothetical protein